MPPDDPLGRHGPTLEEFLSKGPVVRENLPQVGDTLKFMYKPMDKFILR